MFIVTVLSVILYLHCRGYRDFCFPGKMIAFGFRKQNFVFDIAKVVNRKKIPLLSDYRWNAEVRFLIDRT